MPSSDPAVVVHNRNEHRMMEDAGMRLDLFLKTSVLALHQHFALKPTPIIIIVWLCSSQTTLILCFLFQEQTSGHAVREDN
jgi:hypothetical protein